LVDLNLPIFPPAINHFLLQSST